MTALTHPAAQAELADHLVRAAAGDTESFMRFYDATSGYAFDLALTRARTLGLRRAAARAFAEREVEARYTRAWLHCVEQGSSGLSPLAWVLTLPATTSGNDEVACA